MTIKDFKKIGDENHLYTFNEEDYENIFNFVCDCLDFYRNETEKNEPYATNTIKRLITAKNEINDLIYLLWENN